MYIKNVNLGKCFEFVKNNKYNTINSILPKMVLFYIKYK